MAHAIYGRFWIEKKDKPLGKGIISMALRIALAQINATVGDLTGNRDKILEGLEKARQAGAGLVAFPELAVTGYPPEDLLLKPDFVESAQEF